MLRLVQRAVAHHHQPHGEHQALFAGQGAPDVLAFLFRIHGIDHDRGAELELFVGQRLQRRGRQQSPVAKLRATAAWMMADSMGSTDKTGSFNRRASASAMALLPLPGSPAMTMSWGVVTGRVEQRASLPCWRSPV